MKFRTGLSALLTAAVLATASVGMIACDKPNKGPAEKAGEKLDKVADDIDDAVDPKGPVEKAGRALDRAVDKH